MRLPSVSLTLFLLPFIGCAPTALAPVRADVEAVQHGPSGVDACFLGLDAAGDACFELDEAQTTGDYDYPSPLSGSAQYAEPDRWLVLADLDPGEKLAPNFSLSELAQDWKGPYAVLQTHAVEHLQDLRDELGPIVVNSGYRPPDYNRSVGGATWSRHMYGDGFDMRGSWASLSELRDACYANGASYVGVYTSHVHCDWRDDTLDPAFFDGRRSAAQETVQPELSADVHQLDGRLTTDAAGWDEGEPLREWTAYDARGEVVDHGTGAWYAPPADAVEVEVEVGMALVRTWHR